MSDFALPEKFTDKLFEIKKDQNNLPTKLVSYFPFTNDERAEIEALLDPPILFHSIFSDMISEEKWEKSKEQIKKRFNDELFDIDES